MNTIITLKPAHNTRRRAAGEAPDTGLNEPLEAPFRLNNWLVEPELNQIRLPGLGTTRHLQPRLMLLLCHLAANPGRVMPRDALVQAMWPRVVVNENSLTRAVSELRKRLRPPDGRASELIHTIPKRGYRLDTGVTPVATETETTVPLLTGRVKPFGRLGAGAVAACLALALGFGLLNGSDNAGQQWESPLLADEVITPGDALPDQVTLSSTNAQAADERLIGTPVIADDGERFAYIRHERSGFTIYLGQLGSESEPLAIFSSQARLSKLAWSPVGDALLFARHETMTPAAVFNDEREQAELLSLNLATGKLRRLVEDELPSGPEDAPRVELTALAPAWIDAITASVSPGLPG